MHGSGYALGLEAELLGVETAKSASDHAAAWGPTASSEKRRRQRIKGGRRRRARHAGASHVEAERQRRERLNRLFRELRAAVPNVSKTDRASLLADAVAYIAHLTSRLRELEQGAARRARRETAAAKLADVSSSSSSVLSGDRVAVRMVGAEEAMVRVESNKYSCAKHPVARLMEALSELGMEVRHAIASEVRDTTVQSVVVRLPSHLMAHGGEDELTRAIASRLQRQESLC